MAGSLQPRVKTWVSTEDVTYSDFNAEFDNVLLAMQPLLIDDYSTDVTQMRVTADPGESGTESLATTLAGEIARLRFMLKEITGKTYWYESSSFSLETLGQATGGGIPDNRIISGKVRTDSNRSAFLIPAGNARTLTLDATSPDFVYAVNGTQYTITADTTLTNLTLAPSTNNTCLVNDAAADDSQATKYFGEYGSDLIVDNMGSNISALIGRMAGFKINNGSTNEYFMARVDSTTKLTGIQRGYFVDSSSSPMERIAIADNDTITLCKLTWIYINTSGTLLAVYTEPRYGADEPLSPATGDYWFDTDDEKWKVYSGSWTDANATLIGVCLQDDTYTVAARAFDLYRGVSDINTARLMYYDNTEVRTDSRGAHVSVFGNVIKFDEDYLRWDIDTDLDTGVESASTLYFLYLTEDGESKISLQAPYVRDDLKGLYHPHEMWRCLGQVFNNASSNFEAVISYHDLQENNFAVTHAVASNALTVMLHAPPNLKFKIKDVTSANGTFEKLSILPATSLVISNGSTLGGTNGANENLLVYGLSYASRLEAAASHLPFKNNTPVTSLAEGGAGGADNSYSLYSKAARSSAPVRIFSRLKYLQGTVGLWANAPTEVVNAPFGSYTYAQNLTSNASFTVPAGHQLVRYLGFGGGGGGGGGGSGTATGTGGGGGGGAPVFRGILPVIAGETITITVGVGGSGGQAGLFNDTQYPTSGANGSNSSIQTTFQTIIFGGGAGGGRGADADGAGANGSNSLYSTGGVGTNGGGGGAGFAPGGAGAAGGVALAGNSASNAFICTSFGGGSGGGGGGGQGARNGGNGAMSEFAVGGAGGFTDTTGPGGGGGGASWGNGAIGGNGGLPAQSGSSAANFSGAGGGAGGGCSINGNNAGAGGNGGSGKVILYWDL